MAENSLKAELLLRRDSTQNWENKNPVLKNGEPAWDPKKGLKIGDGATDYKALRFIGEGEAIPLYIAKKGTDPNSVDCPVGSLILIEEE